MRGIEKFCFSVGHVLNDLCSALWFTYLLIFYQAGIQLSAAAAGFILLIGQVADAIATPLVGIGADHSRNTALPNSPFGATEMRWSISCLLPTGRKGWHFIGFIISLLSFSFVFGPVYGGDSSDSWAKVIYYVPFVVAFQIGWACMQISHLALINDLAGNPQERLFLASLRYFFTVASSLTVYGIAYILIQRSFVFESGFWRNLRNSHRILRFVTVHFTSGNVSELCNTTDINSDIDFGKNDVYIFQKLAFIILGIGTFFTLIFYIGTPNTRDAQASMAPTVVETATPTVETGVENVVLEIQNPQQLHIVKPMNWLCVPKFLIICPIYMLTRCIVNISQAYITLYLLSTLLLPKSSIALIPLTTYLCSAITTLLQKPLHARISREVALFIGLTFVLAFCLLAEYPGDPVELPRVYIAAALLGVGCTASLVTTLAMVGDLISGNESSGGFVYGAMSFLDKLVNGIIVQIIQLVQPCSQVSASGRAFFRYVEVFVIAGLGMAVIIMVIFFCLYKICRARSAHRLQSPDPETSPAYGTFPEHVKST